MAGYLKGLLHRKKDAAQLIVCVHFYSCFISVNFRYLLYYKKTIFSVVWIYLLSLELIYKGCLFIYRKVYVITLDFASCVRPWSTDIWTSILFALSLQLFLLSCMSFKIFLIIIISGCKTILCIPHAMSATLLCCTSPTETVVCMRYDMSARLRCAARHQLKQSRTCPATCRHGSDVLRVTNWNSRVHALRHIGTAPLCCASPAETVSCCCRSPALVVHIRLNYCSFSRHSRLGLVLMFPSIRPFRRCCRGATRMPCIFSTWTKKT